MASNQLDSQIWQKWVWQTKGDMKASFASQDKHIQLGGGGNVPPAPPKETLV